MIPQNVRERAAPAAIALLCAAGFGIPFCRPGFPAFRHDWIWPRDAGQAWSAVAADASALANVGMGYVQVYPTILPADAAIWLLSVCVGTKAALIAYVAGGIVLTIAGAMRLAASFEVSRYAAAFAVVSTPYLYVQIVAGHYPYIAAIAGLLWAVAEIVRRAPNPFVLALALVACSAQIQIGIIGVAMVTLLSAIQPSRGRATALLFALAALAVCESPTLYAIAGHGLQSTLTEKHVIPEWEISQSLRWPDSIGGTSYIAPYIDTISNVRYLTFAAALLAAIGLLWKPTRTTLGLSAAWAAAVVLVSGSYGPLQDSLGRTMQRIPQFAVFRELYSLEAVSLLVMVIGAARFARWLPRTGRQVFVAAFALAAGFSVFAQARGIAALVPLWVPPASLSGVSAEIARDRGDGRVLVWPFDEPVGPGSQRSGIDPMIFPIGAHAVVTGHAADGQVLAAIGAIRRDNSARSADRLAALGIEYVVRRAGWQSAFNREPRLQALVPKNLSDFPRSIERGDAFRRMSLAPDGWSLYRNTRYAGLTVARSTIEPLPRADIVASVGSDDPRSGWVESPRWYWLDPTGTASGALTLSTVPIDAAPGLYLTVQGTSTSLAQAGGTRTFGPGSQRVMRPVRVVPNGGGVVALSALPPRTGAPPPVRPLAERQGETCSGITRLAGSAEGWVAERDGAAIPPSGLDFGYAPTWDLPCIGTALAFRGQAQMHFLSGLSLAAIAAMAATAVGLSIRRARAAGPVRSGRAR